MEGNNIIPYGPTNIDSLHVRTVDVALRFLPPLSHPEGQISFLQVVLKAINFFNWFLFCFVYLFLRNKCIIQ